MNLKIAKQLTMWAIGAVLFGGLVVHSAPTGDQSPKMSAPAAIQVLASAATSMGPCMVGQNSMSYYNNGPNTIWCGKTSAVTTATGYPICSGCSLTIDITCPATGAITFYCIASTADQVSPADTRRLQVR